MSVVQRIIQLTIAADSGKSKYHYIPMSTELSDYVRQKNENYDPLEGFALGMTKSIFDGLNVMFSEKELKKTLNKILTDIARNTDGMEFKP